MNVEKAIKTALSYENRVRDLYVNAMQAAPNEAVRNILKALAREEQGHVNYLEEKLNQWRDSGMLDVDDLDTIVPSPARIRAGMKTLKKTIEVTDREDEIKILEKARQAELETSNFYKKMVAELSDDAQDMFRRFLEIEEGHLAIVQAELDAVSGMGYWFDFQEFNLEVE